MASRNVFYDKKTGEILGIAAGIPDDKKKKAILKLDWDDVKMFFQDKDRKFINNFMVVNNELVEKTVETEDYDDFLYEIFEDFDDPDILLIIKDDKLIIERFHKDKAPIKFYLTEKGNPNKFLDEISFKGKKKTVHLEGLKDFSIYTKRRYKRYTIKK